MNIQDWFPLGWTDWISLLSNGLSRVFSNTIVQKHQFFSTQLSLQSNSHIHPWLVGYLNLSRICLYSAHSSKKVRISRALYLGLGNNYSFKTWETFSGEKSRFLFKQIPFHHHHIFFLVITDTRRGRRETVTFLTKSVHELWAAWMGNVWVTWDFESTSASWKFCFYLLPRRVYSQPAPAFSLVSIINFRTLLFSPYFPSLISFIVCPDHSIKPEAAQTSEFSVIYFPQDWAEKGMANVPRL